MMEPPPDTRRRSYLMPSEAAGLEKNLSLFEHEDELAALEQLVAEGEADDSLVEAHGWVKKATIQKRERVALYLKTAKDRTEMGRELLRKRIADAREFLDAREREIERHEAYFAEGIKAMGQDAKGKYPILRGLTTQLRIQKNPDSVKITEERLVPARFKTVTVTMQGEEWLTVIKNLPDSFVPTWTIDEVRIDKAAIKQALENKQDVPGAHMATGGMGLRID
jgi:hypothetical protein